MTLLHLRYFCMVVECDSFSKAAAQLFVSQPALSKIIKALEEELGVQLFDRHGRQATLNSEGAFFYENVSRSLSILDSAVDTLSKQPATKEIHITVNVADLFMEEVIADYQQLHEDVFFVWRSDQGLERHTSPHTDDMAVISAGEELKAPSPRTHVLFTERFGLALPRNDPLAGRESIDLVEVKDRRFLGTDIYGINHRLCHAAGFSPHIVCVGQNIHTYLKMLARNRVISILPEVTVGRYLPEDCVFVPLSSPVRERTIVLQENSLRTPAPHVRDFADYCVARAKELARS